MTRERLVLSGSVPAPECGTQIRAGFGGTRTSKVLFPIGDCIGGALTALAVTATVRLLVWPGMDMVAAMMIGMLAGTLVHLVIGLVLSPLLGMFETMVPGMFIGMYGGMLFGMRDSMQAVPLGTALAVGAVFGVLVVLGVEFWNVQLRERTAGPRPEKNETADGRRWTPMDRAEDRPSAVPAASAGDSRVPSARGQGETK